MPLLASYILPHPPLAIPAVGRGEEAKIGSTLAGYREVAARIARLAPEVVVVISPHTAYYVDWIYIAGGRRAKGDMSQFRATEIELSLQYDVGFRKLLETEAATNGVHAGTISGKSKALDHGILVPLYFINDAYPTSKFKAVSVGGSALPNDELTAFGACIAQVAEASGKRVVLAVSGDLSHKLREDGPYGFDPAGPEFDAAFERIVSAGTLGDFANLDAKMCEDSAECGLSGFIMMAGALKEAQALSGLSFSSELLSHEGPFGVGYGVASFEREDIVSMPNGTGLQRVAADADTTPGKASGSEDGPRFAAENAGAPDPLVALASDTVRRFVSCGDTPDPANLPANTPERAGCFVSIHVASTGELRGCIGTIKPVQVTLAREIIANAVSAATRDPRFPAISPDELDDLEISVDVLFPPEPATLDDLDPKRYGVIVSRGCKRGLLLPDLEGVDTVAEQVRIACMKAGIDPACVPEEIELERFEVVRHE